jgi:hypothetical protein
MARLGLAEAAAEPKTPMKDAVKDFVWGCKSKIEDNAAWSLTFDHLLFHN